ncbi:uncharacterized protein LOC129605186 [Condylostylus longicornis]|uniref:uncharacterized protein LOC129605186 n=1 Tax=Condylostylus longicornis TaxID=2530218 RepID=UPI00244E122A|nr:uncharacterized protein LOC129605186 [Condylostylus longicornis]
MWCSQKGPTRLWDLRLSYILIFHLTFSLVLAGNELWPMERPDGMPNIISLEVMCGKDHMDVHLTFSNPFEGIVSSKGQHSDPRCIYVPPSTGKTFFQFRISYSKCGTKPDLHGQFYENTVVVQYDKDLLEVWDEAKRLRCEWFNDYEKTATKPPMVISDLDVIQLDFRGDNVDCWMEIQHGKGPWAPPVSGIVPLGSTLTLVVAINDYRGEFDMRVKSCVASDGGGHIIKLSDEFGCVLRPKMISRFLKARAPDERATVITYAFFHAFKFPDALSVHIKCKVEICRHGCLDHCQLTGNVHERKDNILSGGNNNEIYLDPGIANRHEHDEDYQDIIHNKNQLSSINGGIKDILNNFKMHDKYSNVGISNNLQIPKNKNLPPRPVHETEETDLDALMYGSEDEEAFDGDNETDKEHYLELKKYENEKEGKDGKFPQGPRLFEAKAQNRIGMPMAGPRALKHDNDKAPIYRPNTKKVPMSDVNDTNGKFSANNKAKFTSDGDNRRRRSIHISDRKARSADVGVSGLYDVISEADLAFSPDTKQESVTVFQGKISEEIVYGVCMPVPGFSILFIVVISATIVSSLLAGSLLYRYQLQKEALEKQTPLAPATFASWMTLRLFKMRQQQEQKHNTRHHLQQQSQTNQQRNIQQLSAAQHQTTSTEVDETQQ